MPSNHTLLIIDDNITNLKVAVDYLEAYSYRILTASSGQKGLERAQLAQPDLILLDVKMPDIDGIETCERLKANAETADIPVIFMTALSDTADKIRGFKAGAVDYITKPIEEGVLLMRVRTHLKLRELQINLEEQVRERTAALYTEMAQRQQLQEEKDQLFEIVRQQSAQLHKLTEEMLMEQQEYSEDTLRLLRDTIEQEIELGKQKLQQAQAILGQVQGAADTLAWLRQMLDQLNAVFQRIHQQGQRLAQEADEQLPAVRNLLDTPMIKLSTREYEVFQLIVVGKSNADIAEIIGVTRSSVSTYRRRILDKLELEDTAALIQFAVENNLYPLT
ncbi:MAG: response regulator [Anaerolineales bacterium]|nr:response regulator [Anaerolineales bacterium]